jgi:hypothetical protein
MKINIWSWAPDGARHQDRQTDWLSIEMWLWLWSLSLQLSVHAGSSLVDFFYPEDGGDTFLRRVTKYLHGATSQKTVFFIVIAVKTSNLTIKHVLLTGKTFYFPNLSIEVYITLTAYCCSKMSIEQNYTGSVFSKLFRFLLPILIPPAAPDSLNLPIANVIQCRYWKRR